jgi:transposase
MSTKSGSIQEGGRGRVGAGAPEGALRASGGAPASAEGVGVAAPAIDPEVARPEPEVPAKPKRRRFSSSYKLRIIREAEACRSREELGALLRREGLYDSHLSTWRKLRAQGQLVDTPRGPKPDPQVPLYRRAQQLERENRHLREKLRQAELIIEVQKKVSELLGISPSPSSDDDARS